MKISLALLFVMLVAAPAPCPAQQPEAEDPVVTTIRLVQFHDYRTPQKLVVLQRHLSRLADLTMLERLPLERPEGVDVETFRKQLIDLVDRRHAEGLDLLKSVLEPDQARVIDTYIGQPTAHHHLLRFIELTERERMKIDQLLQQHKAFLKNARDWPTRNHLSIKLNLDIRAALAKDKVVLLDRVLDAGGLPEVLVTREAGLLTSRWTRQRPVAVQVRLLDCDPDTRTVTALIGHRTTYLTVDRETVWLGPDGPVRPEAVPPDARLVALALPETVHSHRHARVVLHDSEDMVLFAATGQLDGRTLTLEGSPFDEVVLTDKAHLLQPKGTFRTEELKPGDPVVLCLDARTRRCRLVLRLPRDVPAATVHRGTLAVTLKPLAKAEQLNLHLVTDPGDKHRFHFDPTGTMTRTVRTPRGNRMRKLTLAELDVLLAEQPLPGQVDLAHGTELDDDRLYTTKRIWVRQ